MRFNVAQILKATAGASRRYELDEDISGIDDDLQILSSLSGRVVFTHTLDGILVTGRLSTVLQVACPRCLEPYPLDVEIDLEEEFVPSVDIWVGASLPISEQVDPGLVIGEHHVLDLSEVVRQYLVIAQTTSPPCRSDCAGLCSQCGQNLNLGQCECSEVTLDPRLAVLKELL